MIAIGFGVDSRRRLGSLTVMVPRLPPDAVRAQCRARRRIFQGASSGHELAALIAAVARAQGASVVTCNVADFEKCDIAIVNPWAG
jgi:predicted nucleic acid-binding protein